MKNTLLAASAALLLLAGCTTTNVQTSKSAAIDWSTAQKHVVIIDPDIQLGELGASGVVDWRADWTKEGSDFVHEGIRSDMAVHGVDIIDSGALTDPHAVQLEKLHGAVGGAIMLHVILGGVYKLPTKSEPLDYTLGPGVQIFHDKFDADYALFLYVRDTYASDSRKALQVAGILAAAVGVAVVVPAVSKRLTLRWST